jgi:hypothetical protein
MSVRRFSVPLAACAVVVMLSPLYSAYKGHASDDDINAVLAVYPDLKGTPADSCATCHKSGDVKDPLAGGRLRHENHCGYCHALVNREKRGSKDTLNRYGLEYLAKGRSAQAVRALATIDSDGDGFSNDVELKKGTNPGDAASKPSLPVAPSRSYTAAQIKALTPVVDLPVFINTTENRKGDAYNDYRGNSLWATLQAVDVSETATAVDIVSADGYEQTFTIEEVRKSWPQGVPVMGFGQQDLGTCGWVSYASARLAAGKPLPNVPVMLVFEENGRPLQKARLDAATGRLIGQGPVRVVTPQFAVSPPDLPRPLDPSCREKVAPEYRFHEDYEHNGGKSVHGIVAVRILPLPKGTRDIDWQSAAARWLESEEIVFFGALKARVSPPSPR